MSARADREALDAAAGAYRAARRNHERAEATACAAYERLQASPETIEYQIDWNVSRREEAAAARRLMEAEEAYRRAGGHAREEQ